MKIKIEKLRKGPYLVLVKFSQGLEKLLKCTTICPYNCPKRAYFAQYNMKLTKIELNLTII